MSPMIPETIKIPGRTAWQHCVILFLFGSVLAIPVNAAIIYYEPSEPIPVFGGWPPLTREVDMNGNGTVDFIFESGDGTSGFNVQPQNGNRVTAFAPDSSGAFPLDQGSVIGPNLGEEAYWRDQRALFASCMSITPPFDIGCAGAWFEVIDPIGGNYRGIVAYLGVEFNDGAETYYGWMEIDTDTDGVLAGGGYINRWAYNSTPGEPIYAGQIPEPSTYVLLSGVAVLGFAAVKRRFRLFRISQCLR